MIRAPGTGALILQAFEGFNTGAGAGMFDDAGLGACIGASFQCSSERKNQFTMAM